MKSAKNNQSFTTGYHILRVGLGITFAWVGVLILRDPIGWGGFVKPWVQDLLPVPIEQIMMSTAVLDIAIGAMLLIGAWVWLAGLVGALHLASVLAVSGIDAITVRDIGLLTGALALAVTDWPTWLRRKNKKAKQPPPNNQKEMENIV